MATTALDKLLEISSEPFSPAFPELPDEFCSGLPAVLVNELHALLTRKNGFYAFESALHVRPSTSIGGVQGLGSWNRASGWRHRYDRLPPPVLFFAEDLFAGQYGLTPQGVVKMDPEIGTLEAHAKSLEEWAGRILRDSSVETGWKLGHDWQVANGALKPGVRLIPIKPFVLKGEYTVQNLMPSHEITAMNYVGELYSQLRDLPDGSHVEIRIDDKEE